MAITRIKRNALSKNVQLVLRLTIPDPYDIYALKTKCWVNKIAQVKIMVEIYSEVKCPDLSVRRGLR